MKNKIEEIKRQLAEIKVETKEQLEEYRLKFLSKNGSIQSLFADFKNVPKEEKPQMGQLMNVLKKDAQALFDKFKSEIKTTDATDEKKPDLTMPVNFEKPGSRHPISLVRNEIIDIFSRVGFTISEGPEVEDDFHVFSEFGEPKGVPKGVQKS